MSTDFRSLTQIRFAELFDGRLKDAGVYEHHSRNATSSERCLTDGVNFLWVFSNEEGLVSSFTRWAPNGTPERILAAIADKFDVDIVSEHEPQYWGFETEKEWEEAWSAMAKPQWPRDTEVTAEQWLAIRKEAALHIDADTADVLSMYTVLGDPYGIHDLPEVDQAKREYFVRAPGSDVWVWFGDLPKATRDALWEKYSSSPSPAETGNETEIPF